ncbi:uncharacterized protein RAG0_16859 [Rhynchosporium agropyri]|uniref:Uncharacterized protein n=1 Tax=Rhynchosporium agropyri TaxID=914238 RepID=A0A1E1LS99_9HELO|nr:uncharacterized protein RAG0_16859 [Rhynchosporium agropyri]
MYWRMYLPLQQDTVDRSVDWRVSLTADTCAGGIERKFDNEHEGLAAPQDVYWDRYRDSGQAGGVLKKEGPGPFAIEGPMRTSAQIASDLVLPWSRFYSWSWSRMLDCAPR